MFVEVVQPKILYRRVEKVSKDIEELLDLFNKYHNSNSTKTITYNPEIFEKEELKYSVLLIETEIHRMKVYFTNGRYHSWYLENKKENSSSGENDYLRKQMAIKNMKNVLDSHTVKEQIKKPYEVFS